MATLRCGVSLEFILQYVVSEVRLTLREEHNGLKFRITVNGKQEIERFKMWYSYHRRLFEIIVKRFKLGFEYTATDNRLEELESSSTLRQLNHFLDSPKDGDSFSLTSFNAAPQPDESLLARFLGFTVLYDAIYYAAEKENYDRILNSYCHMKKQLDW